MKDAQRQFVGSWINDYLTTMSDTIARIGFVVLCLSTLPILLANPERAGLPLFQYNLGMLAVVVVIMRLSKLGWASPLLRWIIFQIASGLGAAYCARKVFAQDVGIADYINAVSVISGFFIYGIVIFPARIIYTAPVALFNSACMLVAFSANESVPLPQVTAILLLGGSFAIIVSKSRHSSLITEATLEWEARELFAKNELIAAQTYQRELEQAREIQDSFLPPPEVIRVQSFTARYFQCKHGVLGGDWMAIRTLPSGGIVGLVVDVTGKGAAAALVVHAVQSLWIKALSDEAFDPRQWIEGVNRTLVALGENSPQSTTLGLVVLGKRELTYYSAGHVPLVLIHGQGDERHVRSVSGRGGILGLSPRIDLRPALVALDGAREYSILLATDGVLPKGTRTNRKELMRLLEAVDERGADALQTIHSNDDKLLLWIRSGA
jgi:hypothetical protein